MIKGLETVLIALSITVGLTFGLLGLAHVRVLPGNANMHKIGISPTEFQEAKSLVLGRPDARETLVFFGDYECPPCRREWQDIKRESCRRNIAVHFFNFPLVQLHPHALDAAVASTYAATVGKLPEVHERLYTDLLTEQSIRGLYRSAGLTQTLTPQAVLVLRQKVAEDVQLGERLGVSQTPSLFYVNRRGELFSLASLDSLP